MTLAVYLVGVALVGVLAVLGSAGEFGRGLAACRPGGRRGYLGRARSVAASTLLRPAAAAVLVLTGVWLVGVLAVDVLRVGGSSGLGLVSVPVFLGGSALSVLVVVPPLATGTAVPGAPATAEDDGTSPPPAADPRPARSRLFPMDFDRWEQEMRDRRGRGSRRDS